MDVSTAWRRAPEGILLGLKAQGREDAKNQSSSFRSAHVSCPDFCREKISRLEADLKAYRQEDTRNRVFKDGSVANNANRASLEAEVSRLVRIPSLSVRLRLCHWTCAYCRAQRIRFVSVLSCVVWMMN